MLYLKFEKNLFILGLKRISVFMADPFGETCAKVATKFAAEVVAKVAMKFGMEVAVKVEICRDKDHHQQQTNVKGRAQSSRSKKFNKFRE